MNLLSLFQNHIKQQNLFPPRDKLLLAVSGGVDSVVLCELCKQAGYDFVIAHCNFQLRGEESERDEQFVRSLGEKYDVKVFVKRFDTEAHAMERKMGIQEAARNLRYSWFSELVGSHKSIAGDSEFRALTHHSPLITHLVTAHHANDSIETLLMNFFKGTGIKGLQGILPRHELLPQIVRPLLFAKKEELVDFAIQNNLTFVEDSSNKSDKYTRNYFRNQLIPAIKKVYPDVVNNLQDNLQRFKDIEVLYHQSIELHKKKLLEQKGEEVHIPVLKLLKAEPLNTIIYEIIKEFGFSSHQVNEVIGLLKSETGKYIQSPTYRIIRNRNWLIISPGQEAAQNILIEDVDKEIRFSGGKIEFKKISNIQSSILNSPLIAQFNAGEIKFPLLLRKWKTGDYFYPLGMKRKKKLSRFFIDQKLSKSDKEKVWVLEMDKKIIWVVGMRIDERFKVTENTKDVLQVIWKETVSK
jgi:tRNA(Ile)-lysidine synthase